MTGRPVLVLSGALALLAPVLAVVLWDRVRGSHWQQVVGRLALLGLGEVAALMFAFIALNDYAGFLDSWSQAVKFVTGSFERSAGAGAGTATALDPSADPDQASGSPGHPDFTISVQQAPSPDGKIWRIVGDIPPEKWVDTGVTQTVQFDSGDLSERAYVYLPPQYFGTPGRRDLPVLEVFSSFPGPTDNLISKLHVPDAVLAGLKANELSPMVVVMMRPAVNGRWNTACTDVPNGPSAFTYYAKDVPAQVRSQFHLSSAPLLTLGYADGGYCAAKLAMLDPTDVPAAVEISASIHPPTDPSTRGLFADQTLRDQNDLGWRLTNLPIPSTSLLLSATGDDNRAPDARAVAAEWAGLIQPPMKGEQLILVHGGHELASYERQLRYDLSWLSASLPDAKIRRAPPPAGASILPVGSGAGAPSGPKAASTHQTTAA
jgi:hypothetical protein